MSDNMFIHCRSSKFPILPGEKAELVNEGTHGKAFAEYLQARLIDQGYDVPIVCREDWGWWVEIKGQPFPLGLCVYGFPIEGEALDLCVRVSEQPVRRWSWTRFRFIDRGPHVNELNRLLLKIIESDPAIQMLGLTQEFPLG